MLPASCFLSGHPSTPVTTRLVPAATEDALGLLLDDGKADARATAAPIPGRQVGVLISPSRSEAAGAKPVSPSGSGPGAVEAGEPAKAGGREGGTEAPVFDACSGDGQEGDPGLRWRLWHKGEVRSNGAGQKQADHLQARFRVKRCLGDLGTSSPTPS